MEIFEPHTIPSEPCDWHVHKNGKVQVRYPAELRAWAERTGRGA